MTHCHDSVVASCQSNGVRVRDLWLMGSAVRGTAADGPLDVDFLLDCSGNEVPLSLWHSVAISVKDHLARIYPSFDRGRIWEEDEPDRSDRFKAKIFDEGEEFVIDVSIALSKPSFAFRSLPLHEALQRQYRLMGPTLAERNKATVRVLKSELRSSEHAFLKSVNVEFFVVLLARSPTAGWQHVTHARANKTLYEVAAAGSVENLRNTEVYQAFDIPDELAGVEEAKHRGLVPATYSAAANLMDRPTENQWSWLVERYGRKAS